MRHNILITGATGYLGSALCVDLSRNHRIIGLFRRPPSKRLRLAAPGVQWEKGDITDRDCLDCILKQYATKDRAVDYIIHFAAYTDFEERWQDEYSDTNVIGTRNIIEAAYDAGVSRILFAGSIAALEPMPHRKILTEQSQVYAKIAYSRSKALGEKLMIEHSERVPAVILRLGGVFTDWCELPPLFSVMNLWQKPLIGSMVPGQGLSGFPYIHRKDVVRIVRRVVDLNHCLNRCEVLFASQSRCTCQKDLFPIIRSVRTKTLFAAPLKIPPLLSSIVLHAKFMFNTIQKKKTYERAWMMRYVDRPLMVDTSYTENKLDFQPDPELDILKRLPILLYNFNAHYPEWYRRNINRNDQKYEYYPDDE